MKFITRQVARGALPKERHARKETRKRLSATGLDKQFKGKGRRWLSRSQSPSKGWPSTSGEACCTTSASTKASSGSRSRTSSSSRAGSRSVSAGPGRSEATPTWEPDNVQRRRVDHQVIHRTGHADRYLRRWGYTMDPPAETAKTAAASPCSASTSYPYGSGNDHLSLHVSLVGRETALVRKAFPTR